MKTRNVHGGGTTHRVDRLTSRKAQAALALAVSLWTATGGVASAVSYNAVYINADDNTQDIQHKDFDNHSIDVPYPASVTEPTRNSATQFTVTGDWSNATLGGQEWYFYGGYSKAATGVEGYSLVLENVTAYSAWGGYAEAGDATNNKVFLKDKSFPAFVYGGYSVNGDATNNFVSMTDSKTSSVYGGYSRNGNATDNKVFMTDSKATFICGGFGTNNCPDLVTGNELHLSGENTVIYINSDKPGTVQNFQTIFIENVKWGTPVLKFDKDAYGIVQNFKKLGESEGSWATIDASNIAFSGVDALSAGQTTVLIKNIAYTNSENIKTPGYLSDKIKSGKYKIGTTLEGTGKASVVDGDIYTDDLNGTYQQKDLIYTIDTGAGMTAREQTHNTVMGASVSMTALSMGNEFVGAATEGLAAPANVGADGVSSFAQMGGGSMRQETGSHVDTHTWNAILALGHQNKKERGTMEYGAFFEYGTGNYTTHADNGLRGDGSARYTGGGLLAKYTMKNDVYVEGSLRAGSVHDDARNVLSDGFGNPYSYDTNAPYMGFHLGVGREIAVAGGNAVDVYGKYFYNRRNGVSFDAGGHYDLDAVTSSVLRVGARYILKRNKWNFYAGAAYEHEFDGKANGTADGVAIRGADTSGGSFRGELGATVKPGENSPWNIDLNVSGFAGKKQGFTGGVSVAFMF